MVSALQYGPSCSSWKAIVVSLGRSITHSLQSQQPRRISVDGWALELREHAEGPS